MTEDPKIPSSDMPDSENELDARSLDAIRSILTVDEESAPSDDVPRSKVKNEGTEREIAPMRSKADSLPPLSDPELNDTVVHTAVKPARWKFWLRKSSKSVVAKPAKRHKEPAARRIGVPTRYGEVLLARIKGFRPKPKHIALLAVALLVVMRPWLFFGVIILAMIILISVFMIFGYDGFWQGVIKTGRWYANRRPARAAQLHARLDRFAVNWDAFLDRFPEGTVDGLYLPDFGEMAAAEERHTEAMERRLDGLQGKGA